MTGEPASTSAGDSWSWQGHGVSEVVPGCFHGFIVPSVIFESWRAEQQEGGDVVCHQLRQTRILKAGMRVFLLVPTMAGGALLTIAGVAMFQRTEKLDAGSFAWRFTLCQLMPRTSSVIWTVPRRGIAGPTSRFSRGDVLAQPRLCNASGGTGTNNNGGNSGDNAPGKSESIHSNNSSHNGDAASQPLTTQAATPLRTPTEPRPLPTEAQRAQPQPEPPQQVQQAATLPPSADLTKAEADAPAAVSHEGPCEGAVVPHERKELLEADEPTQFLRKRHSAVDFAECAAEKHAKKHHVFQDHPAALARTKFYRALSQSERDRLHIFETNWPGLAYALGQDPKKRPLRSPGPGQIFTLITSTQIAWVDTAQRWLLPLEQLLLQGFPTGMRMCPPKPVCSFDVPRKSGTRARNCVCHQAGNSMNVNCVGNIILFALAAAKRGDFEADEALCGSVQGPLPESGLKHLEDAKPSADSIDEVFRWAFFSLKGLTCLKDEGEAAILRLIQVFRSTNYSTAFSGIDAPGVAWGVLVDALSKVSGRPLPPVRHLSAVEKYAPSRKELEHMPDPPQCIFGDIVDFLVPALQQHVRMLIRKATQSPVLTFRSMLSAVCSGRAVQASAYCHTHGRKCCMEAAKVHIAGTPCIDWSSYGTGQAEDGPCCAAFVSWCGLRALLEEPIVIHENVTAFDIKTLSEVLASKYTMHTICVDARQFAWPQHRARRYTILLHKQKVAPQLRHDLKDFIQIASRGGTISLSDFLVGTPSELDADWAEVAAACS